jgi:mycothione reductase
VELDVRTPQGERTIEGTTLMIAVGRQPNGDDLGVEATGVALDANGCVVVDDTNATGVEGIWALGDIVGRTPLKHMANLEARLVAHNLRAEQPRSLDRRAAPHAVFTTPQVGSVGLTEAQARALGQPIAVVTHGYHNTAYGWAMEDQRSFVKLIGDPASRLLLGAHVVGPQAASLVQLLVQGMHLGATVDDLASGQIYIHPALTEVVEQALLELVKAFDQP